MSVMVHSLDVLDSAAVLRPVRRPSNSPSANPMPAYVANAPVYNAFECVTVHYAGSRCLRMRFHDTTPITMAMAE